MERETHEPIALIDLGVASAETRGNQGLEVDYIGTQKLAGLSDED